MIFKFGIGRGQIKLKFSVRSPHFLISLCSVGLNISSYKQVKRPARIIVENWWQASQLAVSASLNLVYCDR